MERENFDNTFCPILHDKCAGRVCVCYRFADIGVAKEDWQATCSHFKCKLGEELQPKKGIKVSPITSIHDLEAEP